MLDSVELLKDATILQVRPGDLVILKVKKRPTWKRAAEGSNAKDVKLAILDSDMDLAVLRTSDA